MEKTDTKYNIFRLYIKLFVLNIISLFFPQSSMLRDRKALIKHELNTIPVIKVFKKLKKKITKIYSTIFHLCQVNLFWINTIEISFWIIEKPTVAAPAAATSP